MDIEIIIEKCGVEANSMNRKLSLALLFATLLSVTTICTALATNPYGFSYPGDSNPSPDNSDQESYEQGDIPEEPADHPEELPDEKVVPANTGEVIMDLADNQVTSSQDLIAAFGAMPQASSTYAYQPFPGSLKTKAKIGFYAFYMGKWTQGPSAVFIGQSMNLLVINDKKQHLWEYDSHRCPIPIYMGYFGPGPIPLTFNGDNPGWHKCQIWGSKSGWSNPLSIKVICEY
jgi:hypothetical protein